MKQTDEALLRQNQIASLEGPRKRALDVACGQFYKYENDRPVFKKPRAMLAGVAEERLNERNHRDLIALRRPADKDPFSRFLQDHWMFKVYISYTPNSLLLRQSDE